MDDGLDCLPVQVGLSGKSQTANLGTCLVSEPGKGRGGAETGLELVVQSSFGHFQTCPFPQAALGALQRT